MRARAAALAVLAACGSATTQTPDAPPDAAPPPGRLLLLCVNSGGPELLFQDDFEAYVDAAIAAGIHDLKVFGQLRQRCELCTAVGPIDLDTAPAPGSYDFGEYFRRLDYAIGQKGMRVVLDMNVAGRLDGDPTSSGAFPALPAWLGIDDVMTYRDPAGGGDVVYENGLTKVPRFEKPAVRAAILDWVTAVVTQFRARYGDAILYYAFTFNTTAENEYALLGNSFVDTSPDAAAAFRAWLATRYASPADVSTAWGRTPAFTDFAAIEILDGGPPPPLGEAPRAYLDFMAYREAALASFMREIRDRVHAAGGRAMAQYGSVWDVLSARRGTYGFARQIAGYDLVIVDDSPTYPHAWSMDVVRANAGGIDFGNELDAPCFLACASGDVASCCDQSTYPAGVDLDVGVTRMDDQVATSYALGARYVDLANWDNFYESAFTDFAPALERAESLAAVPPGTPTPVATQTLSLIDLYVHHDDQAYLDGLVSAHDALGGVVDVIVVDDL